MSTVTPVVFRFPHVLAPNARRVAVLGSFNGWAPTAHFLTRIANGDWTTTIFLPPGRVLYHFAVDGVFWLDPLDDGRVPNSWGTEYSVRYVEREAEAARALYHVTPQRVARPARASA